MRDAGPTLNAPAYILLDSFRRAQRSLRCTWRAQADPLQQPAPGEELRNVETSAKALVVDEKSRVGSCRAVSPECKDEPRDGDEYDQALADSALAVCFFQGSVCQEPAACRAE